MVTEISARLRVSRPGRVHESPKAFLVARRLKSLPTSRLPAAEGQYQGDAQETFSGSESLLIFDCVRHRALLL